MSEPVKEEAIELEGQKGVYPNVDFYSGIVYERMGIPADIFTPIFAIARTAGWLAHWIEQLTDNRIYRPAQIYEGNKGLTYVAMKDRG
jgi:citrate synthase